MSDDTDTDRNPDTADLLADLDTHLEATEHLPVETAASRWLGEAHAVSADLAADADADLPDELLDRRITHVRDLLANVDTTGHPDADDHLDAARDLADRILQRVE